VPVATIYIEELKAASRGRFAWLGAGILLLAVGGLATVGTQDTWLDGYGIIAYGLVPLAFIPLAAGFISSARASRFVESVFTAPVRRGEWLTAKILVLFTFAVGYYLALAPMMLVYVRHVGMPPLLRDFLWWTPGLLLASIAIGTLIGVLFIGRSVAAPVGAGMGVLLAYAGFLPLQELMVSQSNGATRTGHVTLASPAVLFKNALGFAVAVGNVPATTTWTWISVAVLIVGALALAVWIFLRAQGVETWEATRAQRWTIAIVLFALAVMPSMMADTNYDAAAPPRTNAPAIRGLFSRAGSSLALVEPGRDAPARCCGTILNREDLMAMGTDEDTRRDLLLLLPVDTSQTVSNLHIELVGETGLQIRSLDPGALDAAAPRLETRTYPNDSGPTTTDGHHLTSGWIARVPVVINPTKPWDIGGDRYPLTVKATYRVDAETSLRAFSSRGAIDAQVASGIYEMGLASSLLPVCCFGAAFGRWRRTR
jgi:ABC-type transport system involved in multi-copper enzyme maturation permease subunit